MNDAHLRSLRSFRSLRITAIAPLLLVAAGCSTQVGGESSATTSEDIQRSAIISRGMEWVNAQLHYCQAAYDAVDDDSSCWGFEGSSHRCDRTSNTAWDAYRSDCSGFVTYAWGIPPVGDGGYVTSDFAPFSTKFSHTIDGNDLEPGDALNKASGGHIILFKQWVTAGQRAVFMEEPGCSSSEPYAHQFTSNVSISGDSVYVDYEGENFYAIRYESATSDDGGTGGGGGGVPAPDSCNQGDGYCTATLQCDNGHWTLRQDDAANCTVIDDVDEPCSQDDGYCTHTLQCESGHWVSRQTDPAACTSGPGVQ